MAFHAPKSTLVYFSAGTGWVSGALWHRRLVRSRILISFVLLNLCACAFAGLLAVMDARSRIKVEVQSPLDLAGRFIKETAQHFDLGEHQSGVLLSALAAQLKHLRHVKVIVLDSGGDAVPIPAAATLTKEFQGQAAPAWFAALVSSKLEYRRVELFAEGKRIGSIILQGDATDEMNEAWNGFLKMGLVWLGASVALMLVFYFVLGKLLSPLVTLSTGMLDLENGHYMIHLDPSNLPDLEPIVDRFNNLASALHAAREENSLLYRELISVREEERKQIASDLHDEAGSCLFAITATVAAIEAGLPLLPDRPRAKIDHYLSEISNLVQRLGGINRQILKKLHPIALDQATISELIGDLVSDFQRRYPEVQIHLTLDNLAQSYGNLTDLTVYRCIQEGITNALKHGHAASVSIELAESGSCEAGMPSRALGLTVSDTGKGIPAAISMGFGLTVMRERIHALGGTWVLLVNQPAGAAIHASIPLPSLQPAIWSKEEIPS
jgi:two-component system, NarL family, sensor histidine kinase UhpB